VPEVLVASCAAPFRRRRRCPSSGGGRAPRRSRPSCVVLALRRLRTLRLGAAAVKAYADGAAQLATLLMQEGGLQRLRIRVGAVPRTVARRGGGRSVRGRVGQRCAGVMMHKFWHVRRRGGTWRRPRLRWACAPACFGHGFFTVGNRAVYRGNRCYRWVR
jgi:hypothetical protein